MNRLQQQMSVTQDEYNRISVINTAVRDQLLTQQEKAFKMEESLKVNSRLVSDIVTLTWWLYQ
jgi:hypothetical protein